MGLATIIIGLIPNYNAIGIMAPVILITMRIIQGLAVGGEYGGTITYVAEHAPQNKRTMFTSSIQITPAIGVIIALLVISITKQYTN